MQQPLALLFLCILICRIESLFLGEIKNVNLIGGNTLKRNSTSCDECICILSRNFTFSSFNCDRFNSSCDFFSSYNQTIYYQLRANANSTFYFIQLPPILQTAMVTSASALTTHSSATIPVVSIRWNFDNDTKDFYNVYNGIPTSVSYFSPGINGYGEAVQISYATSKVNIPSPYIDLRNRSYTFDCWVKPGSTMYSNDYLIFVLCPATQNHKCMQVLIRYGRPMLSLWFGDCESSRNITVNIWTHLAFVFNYANSQASLYVDGLVDKTCLSFPSFQGTPNISAWIGWSSTLSMYYDGLIDQLSLVTRAKSDNEILDIATLVFYYSFDNSTFEDVGPNQINGTGISTTFMTGRVNEAVSFNITPSYIQVNKLVFLGNRNRAFSLSFWINPFSTPTGATLVHTWTPQLQNNSCIPILGFNSSGSIIGQTLSTNGIVSIVGPTINRDTWTHIGYTYAPNSGIRLFLNGTLSASSSVFNSSVLITTYVNLAIGHCVNITLCSCQTGSIIPGQFYGLIDEFRLYSRRLNITDIQSLATP